MGRGSLRHPGESQTDGKDEIHEFVSDKRIDTQEVKDSLMEILNAPTNVLYPSLGSTSSFEFDVTF